MEIVIRLKKYIYILRFDTWIGKKNIKFKIDKIQKSMIEMHIQTLWIIEDEPNKKTISVSK
jgi:hypothetical protein